MSLATRRGTVELRRAVEGDLPGILSLLADDPISASRGDQDAAADRPAYERAFRAIDGDPAQQLLVVVGSGGILLGTMQLTLIPGLARQGAARLQIEAVRVRSDLRSQGIGAAMMQWAVTEASRLGAGLVQLTSDADRTDAHRFYERLGFTPSHVGFKLRLL